MTESSSSRGARRALTSWLKPTLTVRAILTGGVAGDGVLVLVDVGVSLGVEEPGRVTVICS